jgi:hypothetical protein
VTARPGSARRCRIHGETLIDVDARGRKFRKPTCLECLPPHHPGCIQALYMEKQAFFLDLQAREDPDFDLTEEEFWERFDLVPQCECSSRIKVLEASHDEGAAPPASWSLNIGPAHSLQLNYGGKTTAITYGRLRAWFGAMLACSVQAERWSTSDVEVVALWLDPIPTESVNARARAVIDRMLQFQRDGRTITKPGIHAQARALVEGHGIQK